MLPVNQAMSRVMQEAPYVSKRIFSRLSFYADLVWNDNEYG